MSLVTPTTNGESGSATGNVRGRPTLIIADDDAVVRLALRLQLEPDFDVVAVADNATKAIDLAEQHRPDLALIDVEMPNGGAAEAVPRIALCSPFTCMVILSADESRRGVIDLLNAGASAYIRKGLTSADISRILTQALSAAEVRPRG